MKKSIVSGVLMSVALMVCGGAYAGMPQRGCPACVEADVMVKVAKDNVTHSQNVFDKAKSVAAAVAKEHRSHGFVNAD